MQGHELLHNLFIKSRISIHRKRIKALTHAVGALLIGKRLTLTEIGRASLGKAKERHAIRRTDRLLGNNKLHDERIIIYQQMVNTLLRGAHHPRILVDWSSVNDKKKWYILRASLALKGRSYTLYQEVHTKQNSPSIENAFLHTLMALLPNNVQPIFITDAGFRGPWFKTVKKLGCDFIGRVRNQVQFKHKAENNWNNTYLLYDKATNKHHIIPDTLLAKSNPIECNLILFKKDPKGRKCKNSTGTVKRNNVSKRNSESANEPWLLATSLPVNCSEEVNKVVFMYGLRMQIEEDFRDTKSHRYGFAIRYSLSQSIERIEILLLMAVLACFTCWLIALSAQRKKIQYDFQSNSIKNRTVLSVVYLSCRLTRKNIQFTKKELLTSLTEMRELVNYGGI
jgi:hypothetical protein